MSDTMKPACVEEHGQAMKSWKETGGKSRLVFLDFLRVIAAAAVVLMHTVSGVLNGGFDMTGYERRRCAFLAIVDATAWCVPVFLMISGYLLLDPMRKLGWRDAVFRYCRRVFLALAVFGIPYALLELIASERTFRAGMLLEAVWATATGKSWAHMWYLYLILLLYAATPLIKWVLEKIPRGAVYALLVLLFAISGVMPFAMALTGWNAGIRLPQELIYLFYYLMGYVFAVRKRRVFAGEGWLCLGLFGVVVLLEMASRFLPGYELNLAYAYPPTVMAAILLFHGGRALEDGSRETMEDKDASENCSENALAGKGTFEGILRPMAELSFGIYLIHPVFLNFFYKFLGISVMDFRIFIGLPLFFAISFAGAALVTWMLRRLPLLRKYVL